MRKRKRASSTSKIASALYDLTGLGLIFGGIAMLAAAGYLIYGLKSGGIEHIGTLPAVDRHRIFANIAFVCQVLSASGLILAISAVIRFYAEETLGYLLSLAGAVLYFATPLILARIVPERGTAAARAVGIISTQVQNTGLTMLAPGMALMVRDLFSRLVRLIKRPRLASGLMWGREERHAISPLRKLYGHCWDLPHCREFIRRVCPAYTSGTSCWRHKSGCYCDERTINKALEMRGGGLEMAKNAQFSHGVSGRRSLTAAQKRDRCRNCAIYAEHQRQKYRVVSPLVFPAVAVAIWYLSPRINTLISELVRFTDRFMKVASFAPQGMIRPSEWTYYVSGAGTIQWLFIAWLSIMTVGYVLHLIEYFIFRVQV